MKIGMTLQASVVDAQGKITFKKAWQCKSYVQQMIELLSTQMRQTATSIKDITAVTASVSSEVRNFDTASGSTVVTRGIIVGTGTAAVAISDYVLGTPIASGTASGQLQYGLLSSTAPVVGGSESSFGLVRAFSNATAATITISEVALYVSGSADTKNYCVERTLPSGSIAVAPAAVVTLTYRIKTTV